LEEMGEGKDGIINDRWDVGFVRNQMKSRVEVVKESEVMLVGGGVEGVDRHERYAFGFQLENVSIYSARGSSTCL
jgi:hypothetical protein